jgi:glycosyltransferase involved in cell wall biosynthesis
MPDGDPRVLFAIAHFDKGGGTAVQTLQLFRHLRRRLDARCVTLSLTQSEPSWDPATGIEVLGRLAFPSGLLLLQRAMRRYRREYDIVQALDFYYSLPAARLAGVRPLVVRIGADPVEDLGSRYGDLGRWAMRAVNPWLYRGVTIVLNAEHFRTAFPHRGAFVIPNMVDLDRFPFPRPTSAARRELGLPADAVLLCFTGKVIPRKNLEDLFWLVEGDLGLHLLLVGQLAEPYYGDAYFRRLCAEFPGVRARLHAPGEVPMSSIPQYLAAADLFVFPSRLEGLPNSVLEAMAAGLPVVASDRPAHRELLPPGTGLLYRDRPELREHVGRLLREPRLAEEMGRSARAHAAARFGLPSAVEAYLALYRGLGRRSGGAPLGRAAAPERR